MIPLATPNPQGEAPTPPSDSSPKKKTQKRKQSNVVTPLEHPSPKQKVKRNPKESRNFEYKVEITNLTKDIGDDHSPSLQLQDESKQSLYDAINMFIENVLLYKIRSKDYIDQLSQAKDCMQAQLLCAVHCLYQGYSPEIFLKNCETLIKQKQSNAREELLLKAIQEWCNGRLDAAIKCHQEIAKQYPRDILSIYLCFNHFVYCHDLKGLLEMLSSASTILGENSYYLGMLCFALVENDQLEESLKIGRKAYSLNPEAPWTHHALSHVYQNLGLIDEGIEFMESHSYCWNDCIPFMHSHNWWHTAMMYLEKIDGHLRDELLIRITEIIDRHMWYTKVNNDPEKIAFNNDITVIAGIIGILWKMDLNGYSSESSVIPQKYFEEIWSSIIEYVRPQLKNHIYPFFSIHFVYALIRLGLIQELQVYVTSIDVHASRWKKDYLCTAWQVVLPAVSKGIVSYLLQDYSSAFHHIHPVKDDLRSLGGSNAQRVVIDETYIRSCLLTEHLDDARAHLIPVDREKGVCQFTECLKLYDQLTNGAGSNIPRYPRDKTSSPPISPKRVREVASKKHELEYEGVKKSKTSSHHHDVSRDGVLLKPSSGKNSNGGPLKSGFISKV